MSFSIKRTLLLLSTASPLLCGTASAQTPAPATGRTTALPAIEVDAPKRAQPARRPRVRAAAQSSRPRNDSVQPPQATAQTNAEVVASKNDSQDAARNHIN